MVLTGNGSGFLLTTGYRDSGFPAIWYDPAAKTSRVIFSDAYQTVPFVSEEDAE